MLEWADEGSHVGHLAGTYGAADVLPTAVCSTYMLHFFIVPHAAMKVLDPLLEGFYLSEIVGLALLSILCSERNHNLRLPYLITN